MHTRRRIHDPSRSNGVAGWAERLEPRLLLSFATTDYYYTPFGEHTWKYSGTENGVVATATTTSTAWIPESGVYTTRYDTQVVSTPSLSRTNSIYETVTSFGVQRYRADTTLQGTTAVLRFATGGVLLLPSLLDTGQVHTFSSAYTVGVEGQLGTGQISSSITVGGIETVVTPAGVYSALKLTQVTSDTGQIDGATFTGTATLSIWLAKNVGPVRIDLSQTANYSDGSSLAIVSDLNLTSFSNAAPTLGALKASAASIVRGEALTLTAENAADSDGLVSMAVFYLDSNLNGVADEDELLGVDAEPNDGLQLQLSESQSQALSAGTLRFLAVVIDNNGSVSNPRPRFVTVKSLSPAEFLQEYLEAPKSASGLVDGDWIEGRLLANLTNVVTSDAYWGARNHWFQVENGDLWALWNGGYEHDSKTLPGQHEWVLTNLTDAAGLSGTMQLEPGSLSGITTGWNAFSVQGIQDGVLQALWWSPEGSGGTYLDIDGKLRQGKAWGLRGNGWILTSLAGSLTNIGGAASTPPAAFLPFTESQGNGRTEFDPRPTAFVSNYGMSVVVVDVNHRVYLVTFSISQRAIAGARPDLNQLWVLEPLREGPSLLDFGLTNQLDSMEAQYIDAAT